MDDLLYFYYRYTKMFAVEAKSMALSISYSGWVTPASLIMLGTMPTTLGVVCALVIIVGSIVRATDVKELFKKN